MCNLMMKKEFVNTAIWAALSDGDNRIFATYSLASRFDNAARCGNLPVAFAK